MSGKKRKMLGSFCNIKEQGKESGAILKPGTHSAIFICMSQQLAKIARFE